MIEFVIPAQAGIQGIVVLPHFLRINLYSFLNSGSRRSAAVRDDEVTGVQS